MRKRKIKRNRPMFKKKRSAARSVFNVLLVILLLLGIAFLGYSVGKPIMEFLQGRAERPANTTNNGTDPTEPTTPPPTTPEDNTTTPPVTDPVPDPVPELGNRILFVTMPANGSFESYLDERIEYAVQNDYYGIALELLADGGILYYNTANENAIRAGAVSKSAISDLSAAAQKISDAELLPYARISLLTDHKMCRYDKTIGYLFEDSNIAWYDDSPSDGGKPWLSAFSSDAREYISSFVKEISDAGFAGVISGEIAFPSFRSYDLNYIGTIVKSADRYTALVDFSNTVQDTLGSAKSYAIEVSAKDVIAGTCEVLTDPANLHCNAIYVRYDSKELGTRVVRADGTEVSYAGLSEADKLSVVFRSVSEALAGSEITVIPAVSDEALIPTLVGLGYDERMILVY